MSTSELIGATPKFGAVLEHVQTVAAADCTVLIQGENGTGKELIARAIHYNSPRKDGAFVTVNCSAFNENLLDSELHTLSDLGAFRAINFGDLVQYRYNGNQDVTRSELNLSALQF